MDAPESAPSPAMPLPLGRYRLLRVVGRGAMGEVWAAKHDLIDQDVAVKVILDDPSSDGQAGRAFDNEVETAVLLDHPSVVSVLDHGKVDLLAHTAAKGRLPLGGQFIVMELLDGLSMHEFVGRLTWPEVQDVLAQLLEALGHCHARGIIHRDLKPGNVFLTPPDRGPLRVALMDFGLARLYEQAPTHAESVAGTPAYMSPEQLQGTWRNQGPETDLYSVGCLGWTLITGSPPFGRRRSYEEFLQDHLTQNPPPLDPMIEVPADVERYLLRMLAKSPIDRFSSAAEARAALLALPTRVDDANTLEPVAPPIRRVSEGDDHSIGEVELDDLLSARHLASPSSHDVLDDDTRDEIVLDAAFAIAPRTLGTEARPGLPIPANWRRPRAQVRHPLDGVGLSIFGIRQPPTIGRQAERDTLWEQLRRCAAESRPHIAVLRGAPGVGKSRLAAWLCETAHERVGIRTLRANHSAAGGSDAGLIAMLRRALRIDGLDGAGLDAQLRYGLGQPALSATELTDILRVLTPTGPNPNQVVVGEVRERHAILTNILQRISRSQTHRAPRPLILFLDDAHYSTESLAFAHHLLSVAPVSFPLFIVITVDDNTEGPFRLPSLAALAEHPDLVDISVHPLPTRDHRALVDALLHFEPALAAHITERTAGNPRFAVQLVADWVARGQLTAGPNGFTVESEEVDVVPDSLHAIWTRRLNELLATMEPADQHALELAACLGTRVDLGEWRAVCARSRVRPAPELVTSWVQLNLVQRTPSGFAFAHPKLGEQLEAFARAEGRAASNHRVCATIVDLRAPPGPETAVRVARHLILADETREALRYLLQAAHGFAAAGQAERVLFWLERFAEAANRVQLPLHAPERRQAWTLRMETLWLTGDRSHAKAATALTDVATRDPKLAGLAALHRALGAYNRGDIEQSRRDLAAARVWASENTDTTLDIRVSLEEGRLALEAGDFDSAERLLNRARQAATLARDERATATSGWLLGRVAKQSGDLAGAHAAFARAHDACQSLGDRSGVARLTNELGDIARMEGRLDDARTLYSQALHQMEAIGSDNTAIVRVNLALVLLDQQQMTAARSVLDAARRAFSRLGRRALLATTEIALLSCEAAAGAWPAWDVRMWSARTDLDATGFVDADIATLLERAAALAHEAGQAERRHQALTLAIRQWSALDRPEDAERVQQMLEAQ